METLSLKLLEVPFLCGETENEFNAGERKKGEA